MFAPRRARDEGQATLEYVGALFVVVVLVGLVLAGATPAGQAIAAKICQAFGASCAAPADPAQRALDLGIKCVVARSDSKQELNGSVEVRVEKTSKGTATAYGDGTGQVVVSDGGAVGVDLFSTGAEVGNSGVGAKGSVTAGGSLGYVYKFPKEFGGADAANSMFADRTDAGSRVTDAVLPGASTVREGLTRVTDGIGNWLSDHLGGTSAADRAARAREQQAQQADAVQVALSAQGKIGLNAGAGVKIPGLDAAGKKTSKELGGPIGAEAEGKLNLDGTVTIPLHTGGPDAVAPSFSGELSLAGSGSAGVGALGNLLPIGNVNGNAGGKVNYTVGFDNQGNPTTLTLTTETTLGGGTGGRVKPVGSNNQIKGSDKGANVDVTSTVLDLKTGTPQGAANRAAFDQVFDTFGVSADGHTAKAAIPKVLLEPTPVALINGKSLFDGFTALSGRLSSDGIVTTTSYKETSSDFSVDGKFLGVGLGGSWTNGNRQLQGSSVHDNRTGTDIQLASCPGS